MRWSNHRWKVSLLYLIFICLYLKSKCQENASAFLKATRRDYVIAQMGYSKSSKLWRFAQFLINLLNEMLSISLLEQHTREKFLNFRSNEISNAFSFHFNISSVRNYVFDSIFIFCFKTLYLGQ